MPNQTIRNFGWPETHIAETDHWMVLLRPAQPTLGALVLAAKSDATAWGALPAAAHADLGRVIPAVETMLRKAVGYEKINYLMLMMVDPHVHFHVLPRYPGSHEAEGIEVPDAGWPGPPALGQAVTPDADARTRLVARLVAAWPG
ncbi:HIT family protein [Limibaculum sp. M0105]|uniref:HIT family protein n=1 Tax=Thermohalobaculum xanthum TaxID=2753746 RepID=A0A8J7M8K3_9RHOB|nr:HIT family protein [Thermohalobaculum xanthum]MBK0400289.1 HIT family protein [Thermohalobaculum xanthum]